MHHESAKRGQSRHTGLRASRAPRQQHFAVLVSMRTASDAVFLHVEQADGASAKLEFRPLTAVTTEGFVLGIIELTAGSGIDSLTTHQVRRGRPGSKKPTEALHILHQCPQQVHGWPKIQKRGLVKGLQAGAAALAAFEPDGLRWWLALELIRQGSVSVQRLEYAARQFGAGDVPISTELILVGNSYVSNRQLNKLVESLTQKLSAKRSANPLLELLDARQVSRLLQLEDTPICMLILQRFANEHKLELSSSWLGSVVKIPFGKFTAEPSHPQQTLAQEMINLYDSGKGIQLTSLERKYASHRNVITWLLQAGQLVDNSVGFLFTRRQLVAYVSGLRAAEIEPEIASVRQLKDVLGLSRREAEALRILLPDYFPCPELPAAASGGA